MQRVRMGSVRFAYNVFGQGLIPAFASLAMGVGLLGSEG